jgi:predicted lipoprotein with Yx(FWY)xxD motif
MTSSAPNARARIGRRTGRRTGRRLAAATGAAALALTVPLTQVASAHSKGPVVVAKAAKRGSLGLILVTTHGATLYRYTPDKPNDPTCTGGCATLWPPLLLPSGATAAKGSSHLTGFGTAKLSDGRLQVTYHHMPLYRYAPDSGTSTSGQGVGGVWFVVHPSGTAAHTTSTTHPAYGGY